MKVWLGAVVRLSLLLAAPCLSLLVGVKSPLVVGQTLLALVTCLIELLRQRKRWLPFPIFLAFVVALQLLLGATSTLLPGDEPFEAEQASKGALTDIALIDQPKAHIIRTMSIVMAAHNEHTYMKRTLESIYKTTPMSILKEIIVVDDGSTPPLSESMKAFPQVIILRHETRLGLIKSKVEGGNMAKSDMIMFLDAHVKPEGRWAEPILRHMNLNYKRVVVPVIPVLDGNSWVTNFKAYGIKMMFDWTLAFTWFDDGNDMVPCMSGGLFGITRQWWHESGEYDYAMRMWGSENIEQSIRYWLCGGEIFVARDSMVSHVFRQSFPYAVNNTEVYMNKLRTVETWFDEYKEEFYAADPHSRGFKANIGDLSERLALKQRLHCKPFKEYVQRFESVFREKRMLVSETFQIFDSIEDLCVSVNVEGNHLEEVKCSREDDDQVWTTGTDGFTIRNIKRNKCIHTPASVSRKADEVDALAMVSSCSSDLPGRQLWKFSNGEVVWEQVCLQGARNERLKISRCKVDFLQKKGRFERTNVKLMKLR